MRDNGKRLDGFIFTQQSLSTFESCPLRFKKRYLEGLKWNSFPDVEVKKRLEKGRNFHLLALRYFMGLDPGLDEQTEEFHELNGWLSNLKKNFELRQDCRYLPEYKLRLNTGFFILEANFDLIIVKKDSVEIWDWKTHGKKQGGGNTADRNPTDESLQTMVYLFVLKERLSYVTGRPAQDDRMDMYYWQPEPPGITAAVAYNHRLHEQFEEKLKGRVKNILEYDYSCFDKNLYRRHCRFCEFNGFCNKESVDYELFFHYPQCIEHGD